VLEGPPDESGIPRESPVKLLLEACNTYPDNTALVRESFEQLVWYCRQSLDRHKIRCITYSRSVVSTGEKSGGESSTFGDQKGRHRRSRVRKLAQIRGRLSGGVVLGVSFAPDQSGIYGVFVLSRWW
jgi:hypothetical protein